MLLLVGVLSTAAPGSAGLRGEDSDASVIAFVHWSADGRGGRYRLYAFDPQTREVRAARCVRGDVPRLWSPDGTRMIVFGPRDSVSVLSTESGRLERLGHSVANAAWSPDSRRLAVVQSAGTGWPRLSVISLEDDRIRELTRGRNPEWAPDERIFFVGSGGTFSISSEGGEKLRVARDLARGLAVSPDGKKIAFEGDGPRSGLFVADALGHNRRQLYTGFFAGIAWSPDSKRIAFAPMSSGRGVMVINADGTALTKLDRSARAYAFNPTWSPDGRFIVYGSPYATLDSGVTFDDLFVVPSGGGRPQRITAGQRLRGSYDSPAWLPRSVLGNWKTSPLRAC